MIGRTAAVVIPLFSLNSADDLGRGDIGGMLPMGELARAMGFRLIQLLPLDETAPGELSPYSAMSVAAIDPSYLALKGLPGIDPAALAQARTANRSEPRDPVRHRATKLNLLDQAFQHFRNEATPADRRAADEFASDNADWLPDYALFRALKEKYHWASWHQWPQDLQRREPKALAEAARELGVAIEFYTWLQFIAHRQWAALRAELAKLGVLLGGDMAFSPGHESAEVWTNQELFDLHRTVGAPPDAFSLTGQRWGLPMPNWPRMRERGYRFIRMRVRRARQLYDLLRIDHVVGLYRTFSFGLTPDSPGEFYPSTEPAQLVHGEEVIGAIVQEAGEMAIIAEDLGTVPPFVRQSLTRFGIPGYKVMRWEKTWQSPKPRYLRPAEYGELSLATSGTHDSEPMVEWWRELPVHERREFVEALQLEGLDWHAAQLDERGIDAILTSLYGAPSRYALVPIQDAFGWDGRINIPGTVSELNWTWRLPFELEEVHNHPPIAARAKTLKAIAVRNRRDS
ncbi:MAG TPA: 4-alpha-glucanotransferase [Candidatus Binataceae bacterium]|nr:4-alpha-glucanotransferase [Candidatus Binataceae bacterium]